MNPNQPIRRQSRLPVGLAAYSAPTLFRLVRQNPRNEESGQDEDTDMVELATKWNLAGVEAPLEGILPDLNDNTLDEFHHRLSGLGMWLVADSGVVDEQSLAALLPRAKRAGARVVRATLSTILEGARSRMTGGWSAHLDEMRGRIDAVRPLLEANDLVLALEDHQDATSDELISLCEAGGERVGITLDAANPLAVGEEPLEFARKAGPWIRNVHLKDYRVLRTESGYRLVRCALGDGAIPWSEMLPLLREVAPNATQNIELGALRARHIRVLEDDWWETFPPRDIRQMLPLLRFVSEKEDKSGEDWRTPRERGGTTREVADYELSQLERSVSFLSSYYSEGAIIK